MSNFKKSTTNKEDSYKTCFGHPDLDAILQNQLLKGEIITIEEDQPTTLYLQLLRYYIGTAHHLGHKTIIYDIEKWSNMIPQLAQKSQSQQQLQQSNQPQIAWRYQQMQKNKLTNPNLPQLDLSKNVPIEINVKNLSSFSTYEQLLQSITQTYQQSLQSSSDTQPKKLLIRNIFNPLIELKGNLAIFLFGLKVLLRSSHMLCLITIPQKFNGRDLLMHFSDVFISVKEIFENQQFSEFQGILRLEKLGSCATYKQIKVDLNEWGIKATQSKLEIEMLYETVENDDKEENKQMEF